MCFGSVYTYILYCCSVPHTLTFKALTIKCDPHLGSSTENHCLKWNALQTVPLGFNMAGETSCPLTRWFKAAPLMSRLLSVKLSQCKCRVSIISQSSVEMLPLHFLLWAAPPTFFFLPGGSRAVAGRNVIGLIPFSLIASAVWVLSLCSVTCLPACLSRATEKPLTHKHTFSHFLPVTLS